MNPLQWLQLLSAARKAFDAGARLVGAARPSSSSSSADRDVEAAAASFTAGYMAGRSDERWAQLERERVARAGKELEAAVNPSHVIEPEPLFDCVTCGHLSTDHGMVWRGDITRRPCTHNCGCMDARHPDD